MNAIAALDRALFAWVVTHRVAFLDTPLWALSQAADSAILWVALALLLTMTRRLALRGFVQVVGAVSLASLISGGLLKPLVQRTRPLAADAVELIGRLPISPSFPSGHATNAFAAAFVLAALCRRGAWLFWGLAVLVAYSRVYLGVHYPLDVTAGALIGTGAGALVRWIDRRLVRTL